MQTVLHDPYAGLTPWQAKFAREKRERAERFARNAYRPIPKPAPKPVHIEIVEEVETNTGIEVTACNGQVVLVTMEKIEEVKAIFESITETGLTISKIQRVICERFGISHIELVCARRTKKLVAPRQIACYLAKRLTTKSLPEIGRKFGGRDHTTILYSIRHVEELMEREPATRDLVNQCLADLGCEASS